MEDLTKRLHAWVQDSLDEDGMFPGIAFGLHKDGTVIMAALAITGPDTFRDSLWAVYDVIQRESLKEMIMGLDFYAKPGQQVEFADFIGVLHWVDGCWRYGIIPYQKPLAGQPAIVRPIDWGHPFWKQRLREYHAAVHASFKKVRDTGFLEFKEIPLGTPNYG